jgi:anti-sigma B factor antagonist
MEILEVHKEKYISLTPKGELDANSSIHIDEKIGDLIHEKKVNFLINCSELTYISSAGLGVFISYLDEIKEQGGRIVFSDMKENIRDVFDLLGLSEIVTIVNTSDDADKLMTT